MQRPSGVRVLVLVGDAHARAVERQRLDHDAEAGAVGRLRDAGGESGERVSHRRRPTLLARGCATGPGLRYLHPTAGFAIIALAAYAASLGLRSRSARPGAALARRRHARLGPWLYALFLVNWLAGLATVEWVYPEVEDASEAHFAVGSAIMAILTAAALLSRRISTSPRARAIHPILGATALLLCGVQIFLGLQLLP